jgi:hypothetical protein
LKPIGIAPCKFILTNNLLNTTVDWVIDFEKEFQIGSLTNNNFKVIIGQNRYKQKLGTTEFAVSFSDTLHPFYQGFSEVAFLVTDWIKIQDSLEMVFNLLTGSSKKALQVLSYLRCNDISAIEFANYLVEKRNLVLINRKNGPNELNLDEHICKLTQSINTEHGSVEILYVGEKSIVPSLNDAKGLIKKISRVIHPSGVTLNTLSEEYYAVWYQQDNKALKPHLEDVDLANFKVL